MDLVRPCGRQMEMKAERLQGLADDLPMSAAWTCVGAGAHDSRERCWAHGIAEGKDGG